VGALVCLVARRLELARVVSVAAVAAVIAGWALAQRPEMLPGVTVQEAAAGRATLIAVLVGLAFGALILMPSLAVLFRMVLRGRFDPGAAEARIGEVLPAPLAGETRRATVICLVGLVAGGLTLFIGDDDWTILVGITLLLGLGGYGFVVVARSLAGPGPESEGRAID
jgi:cytochrome d ubiquinol oxidase subunit II